MIGFLLVGGFKPPYFRSVSTNLRIKFYEALFTLERDMQERQSSREYCQEQRKHKIHHCVSCHPSHQPGQKREDQKAADSDPNVGLPDHAVQALDEINGGEQPVDERVATEIGRASCRERVLACV